MDEATQALPSEALAATSARDILKERARALAKTLAVQESSVARSVVVFGLGDERYAIETRFVFAVQRICEVFPLPGAAAHVLGLTSLQGELLVVFDVRVLLDIACPARSEASRMLVLGDKQAELVVIADVVHEVQSLHDHELFQPPASLGEAQRPYVCAVTREAISLFDASALLTSPQLYVDESGAGPLP
jgi:purine-binding chemotaxis protein CheW